MIRRARNDSIANIMKYGYNEYGRLVFTIEYCVAGYALDIITRLYDPDRFANI